MYGYSKSYKHVYMRLFCMVGRRKVPLQVWIDANLNKILRERLPAQKGELSKFVEKAIREKLEREGVKV